jgi:myo-inositol 2-dehydrogenase/D-chiro-inositol 1-dehydrogenase
MGVHEFDQARWLLGEELELMAATGAGPNTAPRPAADPDCATILGRSAGGAAVTVSLGRHFPHADSCWLEIWGTAGYERIPFMWGLDDETVFERSMVRQAEAFARAVRGSPCEGAQVQDAIAALTFAHRAAAMMADSGAST